MIEDIYRVFRGRSFLFYPDGLRAAYRGQVFIHYRDLTVGFRLVVRIKEKEE